MQTRSDSNIYAGFFVRFAAYLADSIIASILSLTLVSPLYAAKAAGMDFLGKNILFNFTIINIISYLLFVAYFVLLTYFGHSTPGKKIFRLEVITEDGSWNFINILYRETIGRFLSGLMNIGYLAIIVTEKKQGFHDKLCDTCVIYKGAVLSEDEILRKQLSSEGKLPPKQQRCVDSMQWQWLRRMQRICRIVTELRLQQRLYRTVTQHLPCRMVTQHLRLCRARMLQKPQKLCRMITEHRLRKMKQHLQKPDRIKLILMNLIRMKLIPTKRKTEIN